MSSTLPDLLVSRPRAVRGTQVAPEKTFGLVRSVVLLLTFLSQPLLTQAQTTTVDDHADPGSVVTLRVPGFERRGLVELSDGVLRAELVNQRDQPVDTQFTIDVQAHGVRRSHSIGSYALAGDETRLVEVAVADLGINPDALETSAILTPRLSSSEPSGAEIDGLASTAYYLHRHKRRGIILYDERNLVRRFRGGDLNGLFKDESGRDPFRKQVKIFAGPGEGEPDGWASTPVFSSGKRTICVHWGYTSHDHKSGERYYKNAEPMAARGVKITVYQQGQPTQTQYAGSDDGCAAFSLNEGLAYANIEAEARIGVNDNILIRAYDDDKMREKLTLKKWAYYFQASDNATHLHIPAGKSSTMMALGGFVAYRLDQMEPVYNADVPNRVYYLDLVYRDDLVNSSASQSWVRVSKSQWERKFLYGHEVGHWYSHNRDIDFNASYSHDGDSPACWSSGTSDKFTHLLRSAENNIAAMNEGWAHFLSTLAWNGQGWVAPRFRYYKIMKDYANDEGYYEDLHNGMNVVDMAAPIDNPNPLGGVRDWRGAMCGSDAPQYYSVELDWARFFVNYLEGNLWSDLGSAPPSFAQLIAHMQYTQREKYQPDVNDPNYRYKAYHYLYSALTDAALMQLELVPRWELLAEEYGVDAIWP